MHFRKRQCPVTNVKFLYQGKELENVEAYKYLGVHLNYWLDNAFTSEYLAKAASRSLGQMLSKTRSNFVLTFRVYSRLFDATVVPILDYAIGAWGTGPRGNHHKKLDYVQNRAIRFYCGVPRTCPLVGIYGDTGWVPGVVRRDLETIRVYNCIVKSELNRLPRKIFAWDKELDAPNGWSNNVKNILNSIDMSSQWENSEVVNLPLAKKRLMEWYVGAWKEEKSKRSKLELYDQLKPEYGTEFYLKSNLNKYNRSLLCQLRCGVLNLEIETARYSGTPRENQICKLCQVDVESELHFLFDCVKLNSCRTTLYHDCNEALTYSPPISRLQFLMTKPYFLGKFISELWQTRNLLLCKSKMKTVND